MRYIYKVYDLYTTKEYYFTNKFKVNKFIKKYMNQFSDDDDLYHFEITRILVK